MSLTACVMRPAVTRAVKQFLETTTLHGFKYLCSPFTCDRVYWWSWCCVSAGCAGVLCAVLWARFLQVPALLALQDAQAAQTMRFPAVAVCASPPRVAQLFRQKMSIGENETDIYLPALFNSLLRSKTLTAVQIEFLENVLTTHNMTLAEALLHVAEPCPSTVSACRWRERMVPCGALFHKRITSWGVCCLTHSGVLNEELDDGALMTVQKLDLMLQCSNEIVPNGCEFYTNYVVQDAILPLTLTRGHSYRAQVTFTAVRDLGQEKLLDGCVEDPEYSTKRCLRACKEHLCGCLDPLSSRVNDPSLSVCTLRQASCLKSVKLNDTSCRCLPSCRKITTQTMLEGSRTNEIHRTYDPFFAHGNASSVALSIRVQHSGSKIFGLMYNDTWWSVLSSLGGVFNMFLGVGLFSVLELVFLLTARLPAALRRSTELPPPPPPPAVRSPRYIHKHKSNSFRVYYY